MEDKTIKLCLFFQDTTPTINFYTKNRVTRNKRLRRQSEDILEKLNWHLGEEFTKAEIKTLRRYHRNLIINAANYKEIKHGKEVNEHKENDIDKSEHEYDLGLEHECDTSIEIKNDKEHEYEYDAKLEQENNILTEDRETTIERETEKKE